MKENKKEERKRIFISKALEVHKDENLDYSKVEYVDNRTKVCIIDHDLDENGEEYGEYWQTPYNHLKGQSHPRKRGIKISSNKRSNTEIFIEKAKKAHPFENLDYSEVEYVNAVTKVKIMDHDLDENGEEYGEYWQEPSVHLKGCGHPRKGKNKRIVTRTDTQDIFISKAKLVHSDKDYDYSRVEYKTSRDKVCIICNKESKQYGRHGEFWIMPTNLLSGKGCPKCGNHFSKKEDEIKEIIGTYCKVEEHNKSILNGLEIDLFIPSKYVGIEYNGLRWHSEFFGGKTSKYHLNKTLLANEKGVKLLQIFEDEYVNHKDIVMNKIKHILGISEECEKIMARKCEIRVIDRVLAEEFLNHFHIQGFVASTVYLGAFYHNKLIGVMSFKKEINNDEKWELNRFASDYNYICQGVGGKLFKYFIREYNPNEIKSFADRRWTLDKSENLYTKLGFELVDETTPDYRYYRAADGCNRFHKFGFRKQILHRKYGLPLEMTETEMIKEIGYDRIWDCGLFKFVWKNH